MNKCIECQAIETSRWYKGPTCNKCYCKKRQTAKFIQKRKEYDASPERLEKSRQFQKRWRENNKKYIHEKQTSELGRKYFREYSKKRRKDNIKLKEYDKAYKKTEKYKAKSNETRKRNYENNPGKYKAIVAKRRADQMQATPKWANLKKIKEIYLNCPKGMEVDHIMPLKGENLCGLHVEYNLQYLTKSENATKKNKVKV
jgi:hypothetical protein